MDISNEYYETVQCTYNDGDGFWTVDAWRTQDEDEQGKVIAVIHEKTADVYFIESEARISPKAKKAIEDKVSEIKAARQKAQAYTLFGKDAVKIYFNSMAEKERNKAEEVLKGILAKDFQTQHRTFDSEEERTAYYSGMDDYDGWEDFVQISKADYEYIEKMQKENE